MYASFERALDEAVAAGRVPGAVALVTDRNGTTYKTAAGRRSLGGEAAMDADTVFWVASMTKAIASVAALQLVERGKLSLDEPLSDVLPDLKDLEVFDGQGADGSQRLRPARREVTLRHLLTHTSGFGYGWIDGRIDAWIKATGAAAQTSGLRAAHRQPLSFDPGEGWGYGIGIDWVGIAIEAASGQRLDAHLAANVFAPLEMADTAFTLSPAQAARQAGMHARGAGGVLSPMAFGLPPNPEVFSAGGGLHSTVEDYGRFLRVLLNGGAPLLSPSMMAELATVQTGDRRAGAWTSAAPHLSRDVDLFPGMQTGWGLATMITPHKGPNGREAGSLAWAGLANTYYWADPSSGVAGVLMAQLLPFGDPEVLGLFAELERAAYGRG